MDKTYQDLHISQRHGLQEYFYRKIRIEEIRFTRDVIYITYWDYNDIKGTMGIPKARGTSITID